MLFLKLNFKRRTFICVICVFYLFYIRCCSELIKFPKTFLTDVDFHFTNTDVFTTSVLLIKPFINQRFI